MGEVPYYLSILDLLRCMKEIVCLHSIRLCTYSCARVCLMVDISSQQPHYHTPPEAISWTGVEIYLKYLRMGTQLALGEPRGASESLFAKSSKASVTLFH